MELEQYGFVHVGQWVLCDSVKSGVSFKIDQLANARVVYAFVVNDEVKYIGICEKNSTTLKHRLNRYKSLQGRGRITEGGENTNQHNVRLIKECLAAGDVVLIYALEPSHKFEIANVQVDLVKGLENPLIVKFTPPWNR